MAWRAWPPLYTRRWLVALFPIRPGSEAIGIDPGGRTVWALTTVQVTDKSGLPLMMALESAAAEPLAVRLDPGQSLVKLPSVALNLQRDPERGFAFVEGALRFAVEAAQKR